MLILLIIYLFLYFYISTKYKFNLPLPKTITANSYIRIRIGFSKFLSNFYFAFFIIAILYLFFFWFLPKLNLSSISSIIYKWDYGFDTLNDVLTKNIILSTTQSLSIILPATLTFVLFILREQRNSFESAINTVTNNRSIVFFIIISLITIGYGYHLHYLISNEIEYLGINKNQNVDLLHTNNELDRIDIWLFLILLTFYFMYKMVNSMMNNINIRHMLKDTILRTRKDINTLTYSKIKNYDVYKEFYEYLTFDTESIFQMLKVSIEKNMDKVFTKNFNDWSNIVLSIHNEAIDSNLQTYFKKEFHDYYKTNEDIKGKDITTNEFLLARDKKQYENYYKLILKNYISLIMILYKNHKIEDAVRVIRRFFDLYPREIIDGRNELSPIYIAALNELSLLLYEEKSTSIKPFLKNLEKITLAGNLEMKKNLILVYKTLLVKTIEKNDVKLLTLITYSMKKCTIEEQEKNLAYSNKEVIYDAFIKLNQTIKDMEISHIKPAKIKEKSFYNNVLNMILINKDENKLKEETKKSSYSYEDFVIYLILQILLKTIETTSYSSSGFLIKFIVTNFKSEKLINAFNKFISDPQHCPYETEKNRTEIMERFDFNDQTLHYCLKKLVILLYGQQVFIDKSSVEFEYLPEGKYISIPYLKIKELNYFYNKIGKVKSGYGMMWLTEEKFMKDLKSKITHEILIR